MSHHTDPAADRCAARIGGRLVVALCKLRWATRTSPAVYLTLAPYADESDGAAVNRFKALIDRRSRGPEKVYDSRFRGPVRVYATPQPCGACQAVAMIYGRMYDGDAPIDLCAACAAGIVRIRRAAGLHVPAGFEWVV